VSELEEKMFAVIEDGEVLNCITAHTQEIAEEVTGKQCVEFTVDNHAYIGLRYENGIFEQPPKPEETYTMFEGEIPPFEG
jgi:hypothetical protein